MNWPNSLCSFIIREERVLILMLFPDTFNGCTNRKCIIQRGLEPVNYLSYCDLILTDYLCCLLHVSSIEKYIFDLAESTVNLFNLIH